MVTPLPLVVDIHTRFALTGGLGYQTVTFNDRFFEKRCRLPAPDLHPHVVDRAHQDFNVGGFEPPTEVTRRGRVGDPLSPESVQVDLVVTPQFEVFQTPAPGQNVVGDVEHMVRLVVRQMDLQQMQPAIDSLDKPRSPGQQVHRPDPAGPKTTHPVSQLVLNVAGGEHRAGLVGPVTITEPVLNSTLAIDQLLRSTLAHSKCLLA